LLIPLVASTAYWTVPVDYYNDWSYTRYTLDDAINTYNRGDSTSSAPLIYFNSPSIVNDAVREHVTQFQLTFDPGGTDSLRHIDRPLVEGGRIDLAHHEGTAGVALMETQEFFRATQAVLEVVDLNETLVLVTADHSHTMTIAGYPTPGNPILGLVTTNDTSGEPNREAALAGDGIPFSTLGYVNGPGAVSSNLPRPQPETNLPRPQPETGLFAKQQSVYLLKWDIDGTHSTSETHGGEDVALFGAGPWSHLIGGIMEQDLVFHIAAYAYGWSRPKN
jgi:hypothetical protein